MNFKKFLGTLLTIGLIFSALVYIVGLDSYYIQDERSEKELEELSYFASDFSLETLDGTAFDNDYIKSHKLTVVNGWAPWCVHCVEEMPDLEELSNEYAERGVGMVGVVADFSKNAASDATYPDQVVKMVRQTGVSYPIALCDERFEDEVSVTMNGAFPATWIVDSNGELINFILGSNSKEDWSEIFDECLDAIE